MKCFRWAARGFLAAVRTERNMRIHLCVAWYVLTGGFVTKLRPEEWCAVLLCFGLVLGLECVNTALEALCDRTCPERDPLIAKAKDAAAGGVLAGAVCAAAVGCVIFFSQGRPALALDWFLGHPALGLIQAALLLPWCYFIFFWRPKT